MGEPLPFVKPQRQYTRETLAVLMARIRQMQTDLQEFEKYCLRYRGEAALINTGAGCTLELEARAVRDNLQDLHERLMVGESYIAR